MRNNRRFEIESPITVGVRDLSNGHGLMFGQLQDIGTRGARFTLDCPLHLNSQAVLLVHFSDPYERTTTIRFEGTVTRVGIQPPFETVIRFRKGAKIFPGGLMHFLESQGKQLEGKAGKGFPRRSRTKRNAAELAGAQGALN